MPTDSAATNALYDVLLPLCDDLPGEPPALLAWSPSRLAEVIAQGLAANGYVIVKGREGRFGPVPDVPNLRGRGA